jgi:S-adenosylmethionine decarboxylase
MPSEMLNDPELLALYLKRGIEASGATLCNIQIKKFEPNGVTILALLSESHASIHTYPDKGALFFDAFTCGTTCQPSEIARALVEGLSPESTALRSMARGEGVEAAEVETLFLQA